MYFFYLIFRFVYNFAEKYKKKVLKLIKLKNMILQNLMIVILFCINLQNFEIEHVDQ